MRVVWLDDEPKRVSAYAEALRTKGHDVEVIQKTEEFQERIQGGYVDVAVIDVMVPSGQYDPDETGYGLDTGLMVARDLRRHLPKLRVILLTNRLDAGQLAKKHGLRVFSKIDISPWDLAGLLEQEETG